MNADVVIVGAGPAGIFTALELLRRGSPEKIVMIEQGQAIENRRCPKAKTGRCMNCKPYCHITTGFSGAGAFSDGKLSLCSDVGGDLPTRVDAIAALIACGVVFWRSREPAVIYDTVSMARRPLGQGGKEAFLERFRQREPIYRRWEDYIIEGHTLAAEAAGRVAALYERESRAWSF